MFTILQRNPAAVYYTESNFSAPIRGSTCCPKSSASADMHFTIPSCPCNERSLCPPVLKSKRDCALVDSTRNRQRGGSQRGPVRASASRSAEPETQTPPAPPLAAELPEFRMHNSPIHRQARERQTLRAKVSDLNGQPFTAAFLAAALGNNTSAVILTSHARIEILHSESFAKMERECPKMIGDKSMTPARLRLCGLDTRFSIQS